MYRSQSTWAFLPYICLLSYVKVFQMFAIPCVFGQQLWNLTVRANFDMLCLIMVTRPLSPTNSRSNANFSFQFIASYVWYSMENLAGDLLLGSNANFSFQCIASYV